MAVTSREERLETFWSHLINCALVHARAGGGGWGGATAGFYCRTHEMGRGLRN